MSYQPTVVDLFCGAGGISQGLSDAGFRILGGIDNTQDAVDTFYENLQSPALCCDIRNIKLGESVDEADHPAEDVKKESGFLDVDRYKLDLLAGGPPCPTFSTVGRSKIGSLDGKSPETDDRHELYEHFLRFVDYYRPKVFLMENVQGIVNATNDAGEPVVRIIKNQMRDLDYRVDVQVIDAADFGVPQHRRRAFFIGTRLEKPCPDLEQWRTHREPYDSTEKEFDTLWDESQARAVGQKPLGVFGSQPADEEITNASETTDRAPWITVAEAILDLPPVSPDGTMPPTEATEYTLPPLTEYQDWVRDADENTEERALYNHVCRGHNLYDLSLYKLLGEGVGWNIDDVGQHLQPYRQDIFPDKYKKQNPCEPASTIVAHISKDGHMFVHPREARSLTVREAARLQSFRDSFRFPAERTNAYQLVGNAVPPRLAERIGEAIREELLES
jgi:DNA (cytosine-5)-methyltransferase 1